MTDNHGWQLQFPHTVEFSLPSSNGLKGYIVHIQYNSGMQTISLSI